MLINKLGKKMEDSVISLKNEEKKKVRLETNAKIFNAFSGLQADSNPKASTRVKLLIKNMLENRASGWSKREEDSKEIKKKAEIEASITKQAEQKLRESEMEDSCGGYNDKKSRDNMNQSQNYNNRGKINKQASAYVVSYPESPDLRMVTFSYLPGCILFHKIALTCTSIRKQIPKSGLLDQVKVVTIKAPPKNYPSRLPPKSFKYALSFADSI